MKIEIRKKEVNILAETPAECDSLGEILRLVKNGDNVVINVRYDVPPIKTDRVVIKKGGKK